MLESDVLVLNSGFVPLRVAKFKHIAHMLFDNRAYSVLDTDKIISSPSVKFVVPSVIVLKEYSKMPIYKVTFSKQNIIYRDDMTCQFCGKQGKMNELTVDHVIPRSRWKKSTTPTNWLNLVCACTDCNSKKGNKLISELGWKLLKEPYEPKFLPKLRLKYSKVMEMGWYDFCQNFNVKIIN